jgi:hypothetical protein
MLLLAASLGVLLGLAHSVLGERFILTRLFKRENLPRLFGGTAFTTQTLRFAWHLTTLLWWGLAALLWRIDSPAFSRSYVLLVIGCTCIASGFLPLILTRGRHWSWVVLFLIGGMVLLHRAA